MTEALEQSEQDDFTAGKPLRLALRGLAAIRLDKAHEWDAVEYTRRSGLQMAMAEEVLALLDLKGAERVLDVGCGDGRGASFFTLRVEARGSGATTVGVRR